MKEKIMRLFGIKGIRAFAIIGDDFLLVQNNPEMDCQIYMDSRGKMKGREELKIVPCVVNY